MVNRKTDKLPFPPSSHPSPQRPSISTSFSSLPLTTDLLLNAHAAAPDPKLSALEQAINERNTLSAQNSQLWKLIEKQRAGYNQILKELERIRGERDSYRAKLGTTNSSTKRILQHPDDNLSTSSFSSGSTKAPIFGPPRSNSLSTMLQSSAIFNNQIDVSLISPSVAADNSFSSHRSDPPAPLVLSQQSSIEVSTSNQVLTPTHPNQRIAILKETPERTVSKEVEKSGSVNPSILTLDLPSDPHRTLSRDSRVSLPDEARRYISNMSDVLVPSNHADVPARSVEEASPSATVSMTAPSSVTEFLELDDEGDGEDDGEVDGPDGSSERRDMSLSMDEHEYDARSQVPSRQTSLSDALPSASSNTYQYRGEKVATLAAVDDFPLPPSNVGAYPQHIPANQNSPQAYHLPKLPEVADSPTTHPHSKFSQSQQGQVGDADSVLSQYTKSQQIVTHFRPLPLLSSDLPTTTISVSHSFIRPNDRGKEVLSFIVHVSPGNGKPSWKVEKMYSDVLSLDQRVRHSVGKGVGKKIASLPEGKLWKDHAPAKVDQRKAVLEHYLQTLIDLPVRNNDEVVAFFTTDIVRETKQPVMQAGYKEGYLTKRGKNFGGWKTRYFVLQGPVLGYYDCRGGTHLGSISITGAQIGRQQRTDRPGADDDKEYRHAFLIVEAKKGPGGHHPRHVLCAESDEERDSWVEMLVRYFTGTYSEESLPASTLSSAAGGQPSTTLNASLSITEYSSTSGVRSKGPTRTFSRDEISSAKSSAFPTSQLTPDANNTKFTSPINLDESNLERSSSPTKSLDYLASERDEQQAQNVSDAQLFDAFGAPEGALGLPSSLPEQSMLSLASTVPTPLSDSVQSTTVTLAPRANSELGHYPDSQPASGMANLKSPRRGPPEKHRTSTREQDRKSFYPSPAVLNHNHIDRVPSPDKVDSSGKMKISGPMNGAPIPSGFKFGGHAEVTTPSSERREKAKSRSFWGFGKTNGDKQATTNITPVFGVPLEESLDVAQICNLPAIVFRAIQYLEAKKADQEEGIYRLSGSSAVIKSLKDRFNLEGDVDLLASDEYWDPHAIAGLLKSYLRELPASILTRELHLRFLAVIDFVDAQERIRELSQLIATLPLPNYTLLRALTAHLILIVQNSAVNKMTMRNVGIVFSPTLGIPAGVFSLMLGEFNRVFNVDAESGDANEVDGPSDLYRRNSRRYSEAAADQLLGLSGRSLKVNNDAQSDGDDSMQDGESETTDGDVTAESFVSSSATPQDDQPFAGTPETPTGPKISKASRAAASRDLHVNIAHSERGNRHSRMMGLPVSPRPPHSPLQNGDLFHPRKGPSP